MNNVALLISLLANLSLASNSNNLQGQPATNQQFEQQDGNNYRNLESQFLLEMAQNNLRQMQFVSNLLASQGAGYPVLNQANPFLNSFLNPAFANPFAFQPQQSMIHPSLLQTQQSWYPQIPTPQTVQNPLQSYSQIQQIQNQQNPSQNYPQTVQNLLQIPRQSEFPVIPNVAQTTTQQQENSSSQALSKDLSFDSLLSKLTSPSAMPAADLNGRFENQQQKFRKMFPSYSQMIDLNEIMKMKVPSIAERILNSPKAIEDIVNGALDDGHSPKDARRLLDKMIENTEETFRQDKEIFTRNIKTFRNIIEEQMEKVKIIKQQRDGDACNFNTYEDGNSSSNAKPTINEKFIYLSDSNDPYFIFAMQELMKTNSANLSTKNAGKKKEKPSEVRNIRPDGMPKKGRPRKYAPLVGNATDSVAAVEPASTEIQKIVSEEVIKEPNSTSIQNSSSSGVVSEPSFEEKLYFKDKEKESIKEPESDDYSDDSDTSSLKSVDNSEVEEFLSGSKRTNDLEIFEESIQQKKKKLKAMK